MKKYALVIAACGFSLMAVAQNDSIASKKSDTLRVGNMLIIKKEWHQHVPKTEHYRKPVRKKHSHDNTNWLIFDLGLNQLHDLTSYPITQPTNPAIRVAPGATEDWFDMNNKKSINVNIWLFMQRISLVKNVLNFKYGLGLELNNYRYTQPIRFQPDPARVYYVYPYQYTIRKNKLAADYLTIPLMLNVNFKPKDKDQGFGFSAGLSAGYLYSSRQKLITSAEGKEKVRDDLGLRPLKLSYIAELHLGPVKLYGSLATQSMFRNGLDQIPYNVGFRFSYW